MSGGSRAAAPARLDPVSRQTLCRTGVRTAFVAVIAFWPSVAGSRALGPGLDFVTGFGVAASLICCSVALLCRQPFARGGLNHWDEALAYTALARFAHLLHS